jgi:hypothetical protein
MQLPSNCHQLKGIAFCLVFLLPLPSHDMPNEVDDLFPVEFRFDYHVKSKNGEHITSMKKCALTVMYGHNMVVGCHVKHGCMVKVKSGCRNIENGGCYN